MREFYIPGHTLFIPSETARPDLDFVPPMQRRRLSSLIKMSLHSAYSAAKSHPGIRMVFSSRYGEWEQTVELIKGYAAEKEMSPMGFGFSVHNAAAGLFSLVTKNENSYTSIAAGAHTFDAAMTEAAASLEKYGEVLVVCADEDVPEFYKSTFKSEHFPFSIGLVLSSKNSGDSHKYTIEFGDFGYPSSQEYPDNVVDFMDFIESPEKVSFTGKGYRIVKKA